MPSQTPASVPAQFDRLASRALANASADPRIAGVILAGSASTGGADEYSDLDLVIVCDDDAQTSVLAEAHAFADRLGPLLVAFSGEHVGEPRLLIALYGPPPQHVDLKFVGLSDLDDRVEDGTVLWQRDALLTEALKGASPATWPRPDPQWIEDRFWTWVHYVATKIGRGELFEAVSGLDGIRRMALAPLATAGRTDKPSGVRRLEALAPEHLAAFAATVAEPTTAECLRALQASVDLYGRLRDESAVVCRTAAQRAVLDYLDDLP